MASEDTRNLANIKTEAMVKAILALVDGLSLQERERVLREVTDKLRPIAVPRAGDVLALVIQVIPRNRDWTIKEIKKSISTQGLTVSDRELYNAIGYLARKQHIKRVGHGRYIIDGVAYISSDNLGGQPSVTEGDLDD